MPSTRAATPASRLQAVATTTSTTTVGSRARVGSADRGSRGGGRSGSDSRESARRSASNDPQQQPQGAIDDLPLALANLQLPHMPEMSLPWPPQTCTKASASASSKSSGHASASAAAVPSLRILVVADVDLPSASALAEYTLQQKRYQVFDAGLIDLCIACGPFCRDEDLQPYQRGRQQQQQLTRRRSRRTKFCRGPSSAAAALSNSHNNHHHDTYGASTLHNHASMFHNNHTTINNNINKSTTTAASKAKPMVVPNWEQTPFFRTMEETAALEGLMTAALSQLESIVCRLVYCPGSSDPTRFKRLTPNSRNINQQWMPLAPSLGCSGLFYMDRVQQIIQQIRQQQQQPPHQQHQHRTFQHTNTRQVELSTDHTTRDRRMDQSRTHYNPSRANNDDEDDSTSGNPDDDQSEGGSDDNDHIQQDDFETLVSEIASLRQSPLEYYTTLQRLLKLALPSSHPQHRPYNNNRNTGTFNVPTPTQSASLPTIPFQSSRSQTILVTHYVDAPSLTGITKDDDCSDDDTGGINGAPAWSLQRQSSSAFLGRHGFLPWPTNPGRDTVRRRQEFLEDNREQICFEIASGMARLLPPKWIRPSKMSTSVQPDVVLPGSLRERGEFSIVHLSLVRASSSASSTPGSTFSQQHAQQQRSQQNPTFCWKVTHVEFHHLNAFPDG